MRTATQSAWGERAFLRLLESIQTMSRARAYALALGSTLAIGLLDYSLGYDVPLFIAYIAPIAVLAMHLDTRAAYALAFVSPFISEFADNLSGKPYDDAFLVAWVFCLRLIVLCGFVYLLASLVALMRRYRGYFDMGVVGMAVVSTDMTLLECNDRLLEILDRNREELTGLSWPEFTHPDDLEADLALYRRVLEGASEGYTLDKRFLRPDGSAVFVNLSVKCARNPDRSIGYFVAMVQDVTESRMLRESMIQNEKMMSLGRLTAGMAHEINNPLGGVLQSAQVILNRLTSANPANLAAAEQAGCPLEAIQDYLRRRDIVHMTELIRDAAARAARIAGGMLEFSRSASADALNDVHALLEKALELCSVDSAVLGFGFSRIALERDYGRDCPLLNGSATQLQQVFFNILSNAAHALRTTPDPRITLRTRHGDGRLLVDIADNGPGMDEATRRRVFDPFFTTKGLGEGTGLGLYITWFIVTRNHGGEIEVDSASGQGARFSLRFPLKALEPAP